MSHSARTSKSLIMPEMERNGSHFNAEWKTFYILAKYSRPSLQNVVTTAVTSMMTTTTMSQLFKRTSFSKSVSALFSLRQQQRKFSLSLFYHLVGHGTMTFVLSIPFLTATTKVNSRPKRGKKFSRSLKHLSNGRNQFLTD